MGLGGEWLVADADGMQRFVRKAWMAGTRYEREGTKERGKEGALAGESHPSVLVEGLQERNNGLGRCCGLTELHGALRKHIAGSYTVCGCCSPKTRVLRMWLAGAVFLDSSTYNGYRCMLLRNHNRGRCYGGCTWVCFLGNIRL